MSACSKGSNHSMETASAKHTLPELFNTKWCNHQISCQKKQTKSEDEFYSLSVYTVCVVRRERGFPSFHCDLILALLHQCFMCLKQLNESWSIKLLQSYLIWNHTRLLTLAEAALVSLTNDAWRLTTWEALHNGSQCCVWDKKECAYWII